MKKRNASNDDEMRAEYDFSPQPGRVQGKYYERAKAGTNLVVIQPDVFEVFPNGEAVNAALRTLIRKRRIRKVRRSLRSQTARRKSN